MSLLAWVLAVGALLVLLAVVTIRVLVAWLGLP